MTEEKVQLIFGALLHDIGKVLYRGSSAQGTHSTLGADFVKHLRDSADGSGSGYKTSIIQQIRYHHAKPLNGAKLEPSSLAYITYFADNISAGMDRRDLVEEGDSEADGGNAGSSLFDRKAKLRRIFNILGGRHDDNTIEHDDYDTLREVISKSLKGIEVSERGIGSLLNLLEHTCGSVPSSTNKTQLIDVSLFDHARTTAGIASCLYDYLGEQGIMDYRAALFNASASPQYYSKDIFLLWSCDMSGIQSFIYNISGEKALKQLRARSFYLEMMLEHIVDELLQRLELSRCNLLYTGGGHANLLLPNTKQAKEILVKFDEDLKLWLLKNFCTDLYVAQAFVECSAEDLANDNMVNKGADKQRYRRLHQSLSEKLSAKKANRYAAADIRALNFEQAECDHARECKECHRSDTEIDGDNVCSLCGSFAKVSANLVRDEVFVVAKKGDLALPFEKRLSTYSVEQYQQAFGGVSTTVADAGGDSTDNKSAADSTNTSHDGAYRVYTKNRWDTGINLATHLWMGDYTAETGGEGISDYAKTGITLNVGSDNTPLGIDRLGVLRADVDNLGAVFTSGLPNEKISLSRTAALSRALSYFFKCELNEILKSGGGRGKGYQAQIIYSGGDDLFIIGNWSDVLYAALGIRNALNKFTGNNTLTISAGLGMFVSHYPIARMAAQVGSLEAAAKRYPLSLPEALRPEAELPSKNALALWSEEGVFSWDELENNVCPKLEEAKRVFDANEKGKAFIYRLIELLRFAEEAARRQGSKEEHSNRETEFLRATEGTVSIPRLAYLLARSFEGDKEHGAEHSHQFFAWATDESERRCLIAALEWYVYSIRERG